MNQSLPPLEALCGACDGYGVIPPPSPTNPWALEQGCGECDGDGTLVTPAGQELLSFLLRRGFRAGAR